MSIFKGKLAGWLFKGSGTAPADGDLWAYDSTEKLWEIRAKLTAIVHAMTSAAHTAGNWRIFHSNGSGAVAELALGADNTVLKSTGTTTAPEFAAVAHTELTGVGADDHHAQAHGPAQHTTGTAWRDTYQDAAGDDQEIVFGAAGTYKRSAGVAAAPAYAAVAESELTFTDITTNDVSSTKHGFAPKSPNDTTKFLDGGATPAWDTVKDGDLSTSDITTNDVSTTKHGFTPKAPNDTTKFLRGDATWAEAPASGYDAITSNAATQRTSFWDNFDALGPYFSSYAYPYDFNATTPWTTAANATSGRTEAQVTTNTTTGSRGGIQASSVFKPRAAENWHFKVLLYQSVAPAGGTQDVYAGFRSGNSTGLQDGIYFRATNAGNWFLVCRSGGVESTVDMGVAPSSTLLLLEFRISGDGASVQGYLNGTLTGSAITTNIPTATLNPMILTDNRAAGVATARIMKARGWGWKGDLIP